MPKDVITQQRDNLQALLQQDRLVPSVIYYFLKQGDGLAQKFRTTLVPRYITQNNDGEIETLCPNNVIEDDRLNKNYCFVFNKNELLFYPDIANSNDYFNFSRRTENTKDRNPRLDISFFVEKGHNPHGGVGIIYYGLGTFFYKQGENLQLKNTTSKGNTRVNKVFSGLHHYLSEDELNDLCLQQRPNKSINCEPALFGKIEKALDSLEDTANQEYKKNELFGIKQKKVKINIDGLPYITQRNLGYRTLRDVLQQDLSDEVPLSTKNRLKLVYNIIKAYKALPDSYVHLDLKPENILVDDNYNVTIIDYGLAAKINAKVSNACTPGYKAPELLDLRHGRDSQHNEIFGACASTNIIATKTIDLYSLGVILSEVLGYQDINKTLKSFISIYEGSMHNKCNYYYTANALWHSKDSPHLGNEILTNMLDLTSEEQIEINKAIKILMATNICERAFFSDGALLSLKNICQNWNSRPPTEPAILCIKAQAIIQQQHILFDQLKSISNHFKLDLNFNLKNQPLLKLSNDSLEQYVMDIRQNHRTNILLRQQLIVKLSKFDTGKKVVPKKLISTLLHEHKLDNNSITRLLQESSNSSSIAVLNASNSADRFYSTSARYSSSGNIGGRVRRPVVNPFK